VSLKEGSSRLNLPSAIILLVEVEEIIIFVEGNTYHVEWNVGERGKYIRDANTNIA